MKNGDDLNGAPHLVCPCGQVHRCAEPNGVLQRVCHCGWTYTVVARKPPAKRHDDDELCDAQNNPLGSKYSFRRLAKAGAFRCFVGPRRKLMAYRRDVLAYLESQQLTPADEPAGELDQNDDDAVFEAGRLRATRPKHER
jgi:hypothetical protein